MAPDDGNEISSDYIDLIIDNINEVRADVKSLRDKFDEKHEKLLIEITTFKAGANKSAKIWAGLFSAIALIISLATVILKSFNN